MAKPTVDMIFNALSVRTSLEDVSNALADIDRLSPKNHEKLVEMLVSTVLHDLIKNLPDQQYLNLVRTMMDLADISGHMGEKEINTFKDTELRAQSLTQIFQKIALLKGADTPPVVAQTLQAFQGLTEKQANHPVTLLETVRKIARQQG